MRFADLVGQRQARDRVEDYLRRDRIPHALLITGKEGWGGLPFGLALARRMVCASPIEGDGCGHCDDCLRMDRLEHADVYFSFPAVSLKPGQKALPSLLIEEFRQFVLSYPYGSAYDWLQSLGAENKQGNISAEACREILANLALKARGGNYKVQIIWMGEYLGKEGNILLKLMEEPPPRTLILIIAGQGQRLLDTIRSRTQEIRLRPLDPEEIREGLSKQHPHLEQDQLMAIARMAQGDYSEALRLLDQGAESLIEELRSWFNDLFLHKGLGVYRFADHWSKKGREQQKYFLSYGIDMMAHAFRARYHQDPASVLSPRESEFVAKLSAAPVDGETFVEISQAMADTRYRIERNGHAKTQLHALSLRIQQLLRPPNHPDS